LKEEVDQLSEMVDTLIDAFWKRQHERKNEMRLSVMVHTIFVKESQLMKRMRLTDSHFKQKADLITALEPTLIFVARFLVIYRYSAKDIKSPTITPENPIARERTPARKRLVLPPQPVGFPNREEIGHLMALLEILYHTEEIRLTLCPD
jgi:hypothetical protein